MTTSRMFTSQTIKQNASSIDTHIQGLMEDIKFLENALKNKNKNVYCAPEARVTVYDGQKCSEETAQLYLTVQESRLNTLKKIKNGEPVYLTELVQINLIEEIRNDPSIKNYSNIIQLPQPK